MLNRSCSFSAEKEPVEVVFEDVVGEAVDTILSALGEKPKQAIYRHLKVAYGISKEDIPHKIEAFTDAIEQTFGSAAKLVEIKIIERLHSQHEDFIYVPKSGELNFVEYVEDLHKSLEQKVQNLCFAIRVWQELNYAQTQS